MTVDDLSQRISRLCQRIEELQQKYLDDPESSAKVLGEALEELQISIEELSAADEELMQQNEELLAAAEENSRLLAAVQEERDKLSALVNGISDEVWFADTQRKFTLANPSALREFGLASGKLDIEKLAASLEVYRPDGSPRPIEEAPPLRALQGEVVRNQEEIIRTPATKELRYRQVSSSPVKDSKGNTIGSVSVVRDITDSRLAEIALQEANEELEVTGEELRQQNEEILSAQLALQESEEKYRTIVETANEGIWVVDPETRTTYINKRMAEMLGYSPEEIIGKKSSEFMDDEEKARLGSMLERRRQGIEESFEFKFIRKDGSLLWALTSSAPLRDKDGKFAGSMGMLTDITERKKAEERLRQSEMRYRMLHESLRDPFVQVAMDGGIIEFNDLFSQMLGYSPEEIHALTYQELTPERWHALEKRIVHEQIIPRGYSDIYEKEYRRKDGVIIPVELRTILSRDENGQPIEMWAIVRDISERKIAEAELKQLSQQRQLALDAASLGWWHYDPVTRIASYDQRYREIFDVTGSQSPNDEILKHLHPDDLPGIWAKVEDALNPADPKPYSAEYRIYRSDGSVRWIEALGIAAFEGEGDERHATSLVGTVQDITERKNAEEELQKSQSQFKALIQNLNSGVALIDKFGKFTIVNPAFLQMFGLSDKSDIKNVNDQNWGQWQVFDGMGQLLHVDDHPVRKAAMTGKPVLNRLVGVKLPSGGDLTWMLISAEPILAPDGGIEMVICTYHDITGQRRVEEALRASEQRFRLALLNAPVSVAAQDRDLRYIWAYNQRTARPDEIIGKLDSDIFTPDEAEYLTAIKRRVLDESIKIREQMWLDRPSGRIFLDIYFEPLRDDAGRTIGVGTATVDLTPMKSAEDALHRAKDELELRVQERTADLQDAKENLEVINEELQVEISEHEKTEKELIAAKEAAEAAAEAKAAFLANMSHELRTPLNAVIGFSSLLMEDSLTEEQKEYIERIRDGGEALLALISDILEFSKAEKEKVKLELQPISLNHSIEEAMGMVASQANNKGLNLAYTVAYGTPDTIICDPGRLRQVLVNLLSNAVKFTDEGDISVSVSSKVLEGNKRQFQFAVKDTGIGMPQDKMDRLFQPFTQLEYLISRKRDGAGLGLAICKELVELMGGEIWAESEEGEGSIFRFTISAEVVPGKQLDLGEKDKAADYGNLGSEKPLSILVAEDNPSNQRVLVEMLKRLGYRADAVADGVEVLQAIQIRPYDLIFMDIRMPEMDGLTATKEIRKLYPNNGPKVVAITAFAMDGDHEKCLESGMDGYIAKPVKLGDLADVLSNHKPAEGGS